MAFDPIPDSFKKVWDAWGIRGVILLSLSLQIILIFYAPLRKKTSNSLIFFIIWAAYLLADWAAAFAVGLISNSQGQKDSSASTDLLAFWAPFLLVHLGGPDTITALALEDNAIWLRHLIGLVLQFSAAVYVFFQTLPDSKLLPATIAMLVAGLIKYAERTRALYLASLDKFKESMLEKPQTLPNYEHLDDNGERVITIAVKPDPHLNCILADCKTREEVIETYTNERNQVRRANKKAYDIPTLIKDETDLVRHAQYFFEKFKGLIVDLRLNFIDHYQSRSFFMARNSREALKVMMVELNFMYEVFFTKVVVVHSWWGSAFRFVAFALEFVALVLFICANKSSFHSFDVRITFVLLISAISLDLIATFMVIFSDWLLATVRNSNNNNKKVVAQLEKYIIPISSYFLKWKQPSSTTCRIKGVDFKVGNTFVLNRRWAESVSAYNFISICFKESPQKIGKPMGWFGEMLSFIGLQIMRLITFLDTCSCFGICRVFHFIFDKTGLLAICDDLRYVVRNPFVLDLWDFIFDELKAKDSEIAKQTFEAKGELVFQDTRNYGANAKVARLRKYIDAVEYDQSLLIWHIATEICYIVEDPEDEHRHYPTKSKKEFSKILSDYMFYLLVKQPLMMSSVAGIGQLRLRETIAEAEDRIATTKATPKEKLTQLMKSLRGNDRLFDPRGNLLNADRSKSVLADACMLAKEMLDMTGFDRWKVMSKVWVEMLAYAASHSRADTHAQQLSKGGELITFVWLLLSHFTAGEEHSDDNLDIAHILHGNI